MDTIKEYKQLTYIETYDGEIIPLVEDLETVSEALNDASRFFYVGNETIAKTAIKRAFIKQVDEVDNAIIQIGDKDLRMRVQTEIDKRRKEGSRVNMEIFQNILNRLSN